MSVDISAGSFVGIVGQSGSGKSTLTKLIPRLYKLEEGRIFIDNYDEDLCCAVEQQEAEKARLGAGAALGPLELGPLVAEARGEQRLQLL